MSLSLCSVVFLRVCVSVLVSAPELDHFFADVRTQKMSITIWLFETDFPHASVLCCQQAGGRGSAEAPTRSQAVPTLPHDEFSPTVHAACAEPRAARSLPGGQPPTSHFDLRPQAVACGSSCTHKCTRMPAPQHFVLLDPACDATLHGLDEVFCVAALAKPCSQKTGSKQHPLDCDAQLPLLSSAACKIWISSSNSAAAIRQLPVPFLHLFTEHLHFFFTGASA